MQLRLLQQMPPTGMEMAVLFASQSCPASRHSLLVHPLEQMMCCIGTKLKICLFSTRCSCKQLQLLQLQHAAVSAADCWVLHQRLHLQALAAVVDRMLELIPNE
jgi:hypothetical protein